MNEYDFPTYPKIYGPFKRHTEGPKKNQLDFDRWSSESFEVLQGVPWFFSEKIDGTNVRVGWDGHRVQFGGRTNRAELPSPLLDHLKYEFPEELLEQQFGPQPATLYGEGYGGKIQGLGKMYGPHEQFMLFDVRVGRWWLQPADVLDVGTALGVRTVPYVKMTLNEAIYAVTTGVTSELNNDYLAEGLVGTPTGGLLDRSGKRIQVKVKTKDFRTS